VSEERWTALGSFDSASVSHSRTAGSAQDDIDGVSARDDTDGVPAQDDTDGVSAEDDIDGVCHEPRSRLY
jgi:hypothetical protein